MASLGVVKSIDTWRFQESNVERIMDNAAYTSAHPDDTLVMAGPARKMGIRQGGIADLLPIGMLQTVSFASTKPTQPLMAIGSGRVFFVSGKSQTQWNIGRLFVNGRNLLRVLYHNAVMGGIDPSLFDDVATGAGSNQYFINLDSELFLIPFGLGSIFRDKTHGYCGGFYAELCMINSYNIAYSAGQSMIMESVTGMCDRLLPFGADTTSPATNAPGVPVASINQVLGFIDNTPGNMELNKLDSGEPVTPI